MAVPQWVEEPGVFIDPITGLPVSSYTTEEGVTYTTTIRVNWSERSPGGVGIYSELCEKCGTIQQRGAMSRIKGRWYCTKFGCAQEASL
jgi:hypothetical protein